jgi:hypothetical protein
MDYACERGAKRNFEPWREERTEETDLERLDRLEQEELEKDAMKELEAKTHDAKTEMQVADALDEIRSRNARNEAVAKTGDVVTVKDIKDEERGRQEKEDEEAARRAFQTAEGAKIRRLVDDIEVEFDDAEELVVPEPAPTFKKPAKKVKKDFSAKLGIKKKPALI